jgi:hypothetical protein
LERPQRSANGNAGALAESLVELSSGDSDNRIQVYAFAQPHEASCHLLDVLGDAASRLAACGDAARAAEEAADGGFAHSATKGEARDAPGKREKAEAVARLLLEDRGFAAGVVEALLSRNPFTPAEAGNLRSAFGTMVAEAEKARALAAGIRK